MSVEEWQEKSSRICTHLNSSPLFTQAQTILAYFSFRQEPYLSPLFTDTKHCWGFPRCVGKSLSWHTWKPGENLQIGAYGIFEPCSDTPTIDPAVVDLILVPSIACDMRRYRLGYGGGYYDRLLSSEEWASKPTIGIVFEFACLPELPIEPWDKPLQNVCTETGLRMTQLKKLLAN
jgi:5-formyltetrahydrofolate cyclo-ligase